MLATCTNPTTRSRPPPTISTHTVWSLNKFFGQPDDGLHTGPKHVVVYYILLLIVILLCSWLYVYIDIYTPQFCVIELTQRVWHTLRLPEFEFNTPVYLEPMFSTLQVYIGISSWNIARMIKERRDLFYCCSSRLYRNIIASQWTRPRLASSWPMSQL